MEVDLRLIIGSGEEDEKAVANAVEASNILRRDYGIHAYVIPKVMWNAGQLPWSCETPQVYVNDRLVAWGEAPAVEKIIDMVIAYLWDRGEDYRLPTISYPRRLAIEEAVPVA